MSSGEYTHDYYAILGVPQSADEEDIQKAYRRLASETDPDRNQTRATAAQDSQLIGEAFNVLSDWESRDEYDRQYVNIQQSNETAPSGKADPTTPSSSKETLTPPAGSRAPPTTPLSSETPSPSPLSSKSPPTAEPRPRQRPTQLELHIAALDQTLLSLESHRAKYESDADAARKELKTLELDIERIDYDITQKTVQAEEKVEPSSPWWSRLVPSYIFGQQRGHAGEKRKKTQLARERLQKVAARRAKDDQLLRQQAECEHIIAELGATNRTISAVEREIAMLREKAKEEDEKRADYEERCRKYQQEREARRAEWERMLQGEEEAGERFRQCVEAQKREIARLKQRLAEIMAYQASQ